MSRIGRAAILTDDKTKVTVGSNNIVTVKGAKSSMEIQMQPQINAKIEGNKIVLTRKDETKESKSLHGLYRALI
ncbi:MAG: 50S ribosomal protein L6, partial [Pseudobdellovibrionaceae bacterium]